MKYIVVTDTHPKDFYEKVQKFLDEGWELYGSPAMSFSQVGAAFFQALIKSENPTDKRKNTRYVFPPDTPF